MPIDIEELCRRHASDLAFVRSLGKIFVVGCAKSGTTWVMNLLNGHPEMVVCGEGGFATLLAPTLGHAIDVCNAERKNPLMHVQPLDKLVHVRCVIETQLARYVDACGKPRETLRCVGDKTPQHAERLPALSQLFPDARFIHVIRDPRDVATSASFHFGGSSIEAFVRDYLTNVWPRNVGAAKAAARALPGQYIEVRYEDLLADEDAEVRRLLRYLNVDDGPRAVRSCTDAASFVKRSGGRRRGQVDPESFYRSGTAGDWVKHLQPALVADAETGIADLMLACGYTPSTSMQRRACGQPAGEPAG